MTSRKQRIPFRDFSTLSAEDREMSERNKVNGEVVNIFRVLMNNPKLARSWSRFADYILGGQSLPARDREILILRIGWLNQARYEWEQHVRIGKAAGLTDDEIESAWHPARVPRRVGVSTTRRCFRRPTICARSP